MHKELKVFTGNANPALAREICDCLGIQLGSADVKTFSDGEIQIKINDNVRGADTFVVQPTSPPVDRNLMELLIMVDAIRRASADKITAVIPYYGYARQDRKSQPRVPITAKLVANLITIAGVNRVLVMDLHAGQIQGFFDIPVDNLFAAPVIIDYIRKMKLSDLVFVSPDTGGAERVRAFAKRLDATMAIIDKRRPGPNIAEIHHVVGNVHNKNAILLDDMIDTGGSIVKAAEVLMHKGAKTVYAVCTHPVFSGEAISKLEKSKIKKVIVTNTICLTRSRKSKKVTVLSIAPLLAEAIKRIHEEESVSSLFV